MTTVSPPYSEAALSLHGYLRDTHWTGRGLRGPDSGVRFNYRIWRFLKSYTRFIPWPDQYVFQQGQAYWVLANWVLSDLSKEDEFADLALTGARMIATAQEEEGHWIYPPVPSRKGKVATVEGNLAAVALAYSYRRTKDEVLRAAAESWLRYLSTRIGFQKTELGVAVNYWAGSGDAMVPNNTTLTLWTYAELAHALESPEYLENAPAMVDFLAGVQKGTGEMPYRLSDDGSDDWPHFLCYQYNAFEFLDLARYHDLTEDDSVRPILAGIARFLAGGVSESGAVRYDCAKASPEVLYYTTVVASALSRATEMGMGDYRGLSDRAFGWALGFQRQDGGFEFFSRRNYRVLHDRRSYPRNLAMMLYHLALEARAGRHGGQPASDGVVSARYPGGPSA